MRSPGLDVKTIFAPGVVWKDTRGGKVVLFLGVFSREIRNTLVSTWLVISMYHHLSRLKRFLVIIV